MYSRIKKIFRVACPGVHSYTTLDWLCNKNSTNFADPQLMQALVNWLNYDPASVKRFTAVKSHWFEQLPLHYHTSCSGFLNLEKSRTLD